MRRAVTGAAAFMAAFTVVGSVAGCGTGIRAPIREAVVVFTPSATSADRVRVHGLCHGVPNTSVEPMPTDASALSTRTYNVRFRVDDASDRQLNELFNCLRADPSVVGVRLSGISE